MFLKNIQLQNYRNYSELDLQTANKVNVFLGPNAQGKTNLLEAIFVLALTKSHRTSKDKELIGWQAETARITGEVDKNTDPSSWIFFIQHKARRQKSTD